MCSSQSRCKTGMHWRTPGFGLMGRQGFFTFLNPMLYITRCYANLRVFMLTDVEHLGHKETEHDQAGAKS